MKPNTPRPAMTSNCKLCGAHPRQTDKGELLWADGRRKFTDQDDKYIAENYRAMGAKAVAEALDRSVRQIYKRVIKLGLSNPPTPVHKQKLTVSEEFGAPFVDVVRWFAEAGHSLRDTAKILGLRCETLRQEIEPLNIEWPSKHESARRLNTGQKRSDEQRARIRAGSMTQATVVTINGITDSLRGHSDRTGVSRATAMYRRSIGLSWERSFDPTPLPRRSPPKRSNVNHIWRQQEQRRIDQIRQRGKS